MSGQNKIIVQHFNQHVIVEGNRQAFDSLVAKNFINCSAPPGAANDRESLWRTFEHILRPAFTGLQVRIEAQIAEGDWVTTRKVITGIHNGALLGVPPTGNSVTIAVIDMVRIIEDQYVEHWGINTLEQVVNRLKQS